MQGISRENLEKKEKKKLPFQHSKTEANDLFYKIFQTSLVISRDQICYRLLTYESIILTHIGEIAFEFHGKKQIMVGIIKAEPWEMSYKTPCIVIIHDFAPFWFSNATSKPILP